MPLVKFTKNLQRYFPTMETQHVPGNSVRQVVAALNDRYPGLAAYLVDDQGALRQHVNIFIGEGLMQDPKQLSDAVQDDDQIFILQALSGGAPAGFFGGPNSAQQHWRRSTAGTPLDMG